MRRDYGLALQAGLREAWGAFPADLSGRLLRQPRRVQLKKIAAEEERATATEKPGGPSWRR